jgi:hypothetical protein
MGWSDSVVGLLPGTHRDQLSWELRNLTLVVPRHAEVQTLQTAVLPSIAFCVTNLPLPARRCQLSNPTRRRLGQLLLELLCYTCPKNSKHRVLSPRGSRPDEYTYTQHKSTRWIGIHSTQARQATREAHTKPMVANCQPKILVNCCISFFRRCSDLGWSTSVLIKGLHNLAAAGSNSNRAQDKLSYRRNQDRR